MKKSLLIGLVAGMTLLAGCGFGHKVQNGDKVHIVYTGTFADQSIFESKDISITEWSGEVIKWLEEALLDMKKWENKTITITPEKWYGSQYQISNVQKIPSLIFEKAQVSTNGTGPIEIAGLKWIIKWKEQDENGNWVIVFDLNKPETYKDLTYTISVQSINE